MIYTHVAAAVVAAAVGFTGAWKIQSLRMDSNEKDRIATQIAQERDLHVLEQKRSRHVLDAVNVSRAREAQLRTESARNRDSLVGLRESSANALSFARTSLDACTIAAATYDQLFTESTERYTELAEQAQRHVIDIETLTHAWPKE